MHRYLLSLTLICCIASNIFAQNTLKGVIKDDNQEPLSYILISVTKTDSLRTVVGESLTDSLGNFEIEIEESGQYVIHSIATGLDDVKHPLSLKRGTTTIELQAKNKHNSLEEVTVRSQRPTIIRQADRVVMNVSDNPIATAKSAGEVLALAPGVYVKDGTISINGVSGVRVMVNNKLLQLSDNELIHFLNSLRAENIQSIEIMAHPPAEYDAEGSGGLINIILKKNNTSGLNGSVNASYKQGRYAGTSEGVQLNFKKGKWGLNANYAYNTIKSFLTFDQSRNFPDNGMYIAKNQAKKYNDNNYLHAGLTYDVSDDQFFALDYTYSHYNGKQDWRSTAQISYPENIDNNLITKGIFPNTFKGKYNDIGLNYHWNTDREGSNFSFLADYITNTNLATNNVENSSFNNKETLISDTAFRNETPSDATIITAEAKYHKVFNKNAQLSFGAKFSHTDIHNAGNFEFVQQGIWNSNEVQNFVYDYKEQIWAGFVNYNTTIFSTNVQLGLRGENTSFTGTLWQRNNDAKNQRHYFGLFPSVYLQRNLDSTGNHSITLSYNRRLNRPSFEALNPHIIYIDNYTSGLGNPYLNPQYSNSFEVNYTFLKQYNLSVGYTYTRDIINSVMYTDEHNPRQMIQQPINAGNKRQFSITAFAPISITKWWSTQNTVQYSIENVTAPEYNIHRNIIFIQTMQDISLPYQFKLSVSAHYMSNYIFSNALLEPMFNASIAVQKSVWKDRLTLQAGLDDIFNTGIQKGTFYYNDFNMHFKQQMQSQVFTFGIVYNFKSGKAFRVHNIKSSNDDEKSRLGQ